MVGHLGLKCSKSSLNERQIYLENGERTTPVLSMLSKPRWLFVRQSTGSRRSYGKKRDCEQSKWLVVWTCLTDLWSVSFQFRRPRIVRLLHVSMVHDVWITRTLLDSHASVHPGTLVNAVKLPLTNAHPIPARIGLRALMASTMWHALVQKALKV